MHIQTKEDMQKEAALLVLRIAPGKGATVLALSGELGAGKTTFVQGIAKSLGIEESVTSPTFVIMKIYDLLDQKFKRLVHMDAYRLKGKEHLRVLGWDALISDPGNLICIEWPEKIQDAIPSDAIRVTLRYSGEGRDITYGTDENKKTRTTSSA